LGDVGHIIFLVRRFLFHRPLSNTWPYGPQDIRFYCNRPILSSTKATCHDSSLAGFTLQQLLISTNPLDRHAECFDVSDPGRMWDSYVDELADSFDFSQTVGKFESRSGLVVTTSSAVQHIP
jgi:hypothetical protein